jgi:hypothetical protein
VSREIGTLLTEAESAEATGQSGLAQTCVHHAVLLRECQKRDDRDLKVYFRDLQESSSSTRRNLIEDVKTVHQAIKSKIVLPNRSVNPQRPTAGNRRPSVTAPPTGREEGHGSSSRDPLSGGARWGSRDDHRPPSDRSTSQRRGENRDAASRERSSITDLSKVTGEMQIGNTSRVDAVSRSDPSQADPSYDSNYRSRDSELRHTESRSGGQSLGILEYPPLPLPTLYEGKASRRYEIEGTPGDEESLDRSTYDIRHSWPQLINVSGYRKRPHAQTFFTRGRVRQRPLILHWVLAQLIDTIHAGFCYFMARKCWHGQSQFRS